MVTVDCLRVTELAFAQRQATFGAVPSLEPFVAAKIVPLRVKRALASAQNFHVATAAYLACVVPRLTVARIAKAFAGSH